MRLARALDGDQVYTVSPLNRAVRFGTSGGWLTARDGSRERVICDMAEHARILVVDDKESVLDLLAAILESYEITKIGSGRKAVDLVCADRFDVVVTEVRLRVASGFEVLEAAKRSAPDTEVLFITGFPAAQDAIRALKMGALDYLEKPFDPDDVSLAVARALEHRRKALAATQGGAPRPPSAAADVAQPNPVLALSYRETLRGARDRAAEEYLVALIREFDGSVTRAAEHAEIERESLRRMLKRYGVRPEYFERSFPPNGPTA